MLRAFNLRLGARFYCVKVVPKETIKYTDTINLPKTKFPVRLPANKREELERQILDNTIALSYQYQERHLQTPSFVLHDGPPYANGQLHMGHSINKILKDITLRQRVASRQRVNYVPGWDCHGLPIELKATNSRADEQSALETRQKSRAFALDAVESQKESFRSWGVMANWGTEDIYLTSKPDFIANQLNMFYNLYKRGLVYRALKPVYWSPSSKTALAEAELEYDANFISPSVYLRFVVEGLPATAATQNKHIYALVWTTTPWTLPSNQAICYNSSLEYVLVRLSSHNPNELYLLASALIKDFEVSTKLQCEIVESLSGGTLGSCSYQHPINKAQTTLPFFEASHVQDSKGTGLVHTAPAHGHEDFLISLEHNISVNCFVNEAGTYTKDAPDFLHGQSVLERGNSLVLEHIEKDVVHASELRHSYPLDWRTKQPVIIRASEQWFINTEKLKGRATEALEQVEFYPRINAEANKKALLSQLSKRPYWCISRQRSWGVPIPVLYNRLNNQVVLNQELIEHLCNKLYNKGTMDFWWAEPLENLIPDKLKTNLGCEVKDLVKGADIFDIWLDSGSSWSAVLRSQEKPVADLYLEGYDQFTGWFQSSLLTSIAIQNCAPYKALFVHGFTVDEKGHKMSKSLGNVISPRQITKKYGTDALRWWVASHGTQHMSITVSDKILEQASENVRKIRGILRYLNGTVCQKHVQTPVLPDESYLNKYLLHSLLNFDEEIQKLYNSYEYNRVAASIQNFIANQVSGTYMHLIKDRLYCGNKEEIEAIRHTLSHCYRHLCKALWPLVPYLIEESWSYYSSTDSAFHEQTVQAEKCWQNERAHTAVNEALHIKRKVNQQAGNVNSWYLAVNISCSTQEQLELLSALNRHLNEQVNNSELCEILQVGSVTLQSQLSPVEAVTATEHSLIESLCPRCRRYSVLKEQQICTRCASILAAKE